MDYLLSDMGLQCVIESNEERELYKGIFPQFPIEPEEEDQKYNDAQLDEVNEKMINYEAEKKLAFQNWNRKCLTEYDISTLSSMLWMFKTMNNGLTQVMNMKLITDTSSVNLYQWYRSKEVMFDQAKCFYFDETKNLVIVNTNDRS